LHSSAMLIRSILTSLIGMRLRPTQKREISDVSRGNPPLCVGKAEFSAYLGAGPCRASFGGSSFQAVSSATNFPITTWNKECVQRLDRTSVEMTFNRNLGFVGQTATTIFSLQPKPERRCSQLLTRDRKHRSRMRGKVRFIPVSSRRKHVHHWYKSLAGGLRCDCEAWRCQFAGGVEQCKFAAERGRKYCVTHRATRPTGPAQFGRPKSPRRRQYPSEADPHIDQGATSSYEKWDRNSAARVAWICLMGRSG